MSTPGDQIAIALGLDLILYPGDQVPIQVPPPEIVPPLPVVRYKYKSWGIPWGQVTPLQMDRKSSWSTGQRRPRQLAAVYATGRRVAVDWRLSWSVALNVRFETRLPWGKATRIGREAGDSWKQIPRIPKSDFQVSWKKLPRIQTSCGIPWLNPPRVAGEALIHSRLAGSRIGYDPKILWGGLTQRRPRWNIPWGKAVRVPWIPEGPTVDPPDPPDPPDFTPPDGDKVYIRLACPLYEYPGDQVPIRLSASQCYYDFPAPGVYIVENEIGVVRLPEGTPIHVKQMSLSISTESVFWDFRATLSRPADLAYLKKPPGGDLKEIEIRINGHVWRALVEDWNEDRQLFYDSSIMGRSRTCLLDAPAAPTRSYVEMETRTAQQLIELEVVDTGFTVQHFEIDWLVPGNTWSYQGLAPIGAIKEIAAASGSVVISHPWDSKLMIYPRYPVSPWDWATTEPDVAIFDGAAQNVSYSNKTLPKYDYIFVSGETVGVSDPILREGSGGETRAEMITHRLITDHPVAAERGRNSLSNRGEQGQFTIRLPMFRPDVTPGMLKLMQLAEFHEAPTPWKGLVIANSIEVTTESDGTLAVWQSVTLERHYDPD